jgi:hypothetical protein
MTSAESAAAALEVNHLLGCHLGVPLEEHPLAGRQRDGRHGSAHDDDDGHDDQRVRAVPPAPAAPEVEAAPTASRVDASSARGRGPKTARR